MAGQEARPEILALRLETARRVLALEVRRGEVAMARGAILHVCAVLAGVLIVALDGTWRALPAAVAFVVASYFGARATTSSVTIAGIHADALEKWTQASACDAPQVLGSELLAVAEEVRSRREANSIRVGRSRWATWALTAGAVLAMLPAVT